MVEYPGGDAGLYNDLLRNLKTTLEAIGLLASNRKILEDDFTAPVLDGARWTEEAAGGVGIVGGLDAVNNFYEISGTAVGGAGADYVIADASIVIDWKVPHLIRWTQRLSGTPAAGGAIKFLLQITDGTLSVNVGARKIDAGADSVLYYKNGAGSETDLDTTNNSAAHAYMVLITPNAVGPFQTLSLFLDGVFKGTITANFTANLTLRWMGTADAADDLMTADQCYFTGVLATEYDPTILSDILAAIGGTTGVAEGGTNATLIDAHLTQADDYWNGQALVMRTGNNAGLSRRIVDFDAATDTITVDPVFDGVVAAGDEYTIKDPTNAPTADSAIDTTMEASIGNKADAAVYAIGTTKSALAYAKGVLGKLGAAYVNAGGNPDVDTVRAHLVAGLLNGTGTALPANTALYDMLGISYTGVAAASTTSSIRRHLLDGLLQVGGTALPASKALYDVLGASFVAAGGNPDVDTVRAMLRAYTGSGTGTALGANLSIYDILGVAFVGVGGATPDLKSIQAAFAAWIGHGAGTVLAAGKSLEDAIGNDGTNFLGSGLDLDVQYLRRVALAGVIANSLSDQLYIGAGEQLRTFIAKTGGTPIAATKSLVDAIGHTGGASLATGIDADTQYLARADPGAGVAGSIAARIGDSADTQADATLFGDVARPTNDSATNALMRDVVGSKADAAVVAPSSTASIVGYLKGILNSVGSGTSGTADAGSTASLLVDAARTEAAADYWVGGIVVMEDGANVGEARSIVDFDPATDTLTVSPAFTSVIGAGDSYNILPQATVNELVLALNAAGVSITTNSLADQLYLGAGEQLRTFIAKTGATAVPATKGLYDLIGTGLVAAGGNPDVDTLRAMLRAYVGSGTGTALGANQALYDILGVGFIGAGGATPDLKSVQAALAAWLGKGAGTALAAGKSLEDAMGHDGTNNLDTGLAALLNDCWRRQAVTTFTAANVGSGATQNMLAIGAVGGTIGYRLDGGFVNVSGMGSNTNITITVKVEINGVETTYDTIIRGATGVVSLLALLGAITSRRILITVTGDNAADDGTVSASFETSLAGV